MDVDYSNMDYKQPVQCSFCGAISDEETGIEFIVAADGAAICTKSVKACIHILYLERVCDVDIEDIVN
jgi:ribosomal protein L24E